MHTNKFAVEQGWKALLKDMELNIDEVLEKAQLPLDIFEQKNATISTKEYYRVWNILEEISNDPCFALRIGQIARVESFHPAVFAVLCSPNLTIAFKRFSQFKRLVGPLKIDVNEFVDSTSISLEYLDKEYPVPPTLIAAELVIMVTLVRTGIRENVKPLSVVISKPVTNIDKYADFFGVPVTHGTNNNITFDGSDAQKPFITQNVQMWNFFEPELRRQLSDLEKEDNFSTRVKSSLLELLPGGENSIEAVASKLMLSKRTLQRRLSEESTNFQSILNSTREKLARFYLSNSKLSGYEISLLLGYEDPNSFFRAFHSWTGYTPGEMRMDS